MDKFTGVVTPSSTVNYGYDATGRRISRNEGSSTTNYHHNANSDLTDYETDGYGALTSSFNRGADGLISETDYSGTPTTSYHLYNSHGDTSALSDQNGSITGSYRYDSFGNSISGSPPENGYTGKWQREKDSSTDTIRMGVREYDPVLGRFVSEDLLMGNTTDPLQRNRYNFVKANPLNHYDITGYSMDFWNSMLSPQRNYSQTSTTNDYSDRYDETQSYNAALAEGEFTNPDTYYNGHPVIEYTAHCLVVANDFKNETWGVLSSEDQSTYKEVIRTLWDTYKNVAPFLSTNQF